MNADFLESAARHLRDALALLPQYPSNAAYLSGYVVECALKAVVMHGDPDLHVETFGHDLLALHADGLDLAVALSPRSARWTPHAEDVRSMRARWSESLRYAPDSAKSERDAEEMLRAALAVYERCIVSMEK